MRFLQLASMALLTTLLFNNSGMASEYTSGELEALLAERDALIIELHQTVRDMNTRLEAIEQAMSLNPETSRTQLTEQSATAFPRENAASPSSSSDTGRLSIDELAAQRALERTLIQSGALLLPSWVIEVGPSIGYSINEFDVPFFEPGGAEPVAGLERIERSVVSADIDLRLGLPFDSQLELGIPYNWAQERREIHIQGTPVAQSASLSGNGLGSLRIGLAKTLLRENGWYPDLVGRITWDTGTGDQSDNGVFLGGFESISGSISFIKRNDPMVFLGSMAYRSFSTQDGFRPGDQFSVSIGSALSVSPSSSLFATLSNDFFDDARAQSETLEGSDLTSIVLNLGASTVVARQSLISLSAGIGVSEAAPDYTISLSGSFRTRGLKDLMR